MNGAPETTRPVNLPDLMAALHEVPPPDPVPMTPQTAGWAVLAAGLLLAAVWLIRHWVKARRANGYRRAALRALEHAGDDPRAVSLILKRAALVAYPRASVAALSGEDWVTFLEATGGVRFDARLGTAPFISAPPTAINGLNGAARTWLKRHQKGRAAR